MPLRNQAVLARKQWHRLASNVEDRVHGLAGDKVQQAQNAVTRAELKLRELGHSAQNEGRSEARATARLAGHDPLAGEIRKRAKSGIAPDNNVHLLRVERMHVLEFCDPV